MKNNLFDKNIFNNTIKKHENIFKSLENKSEIINSWINDLEAENLKDETGNYGKFQDQILTKLLEYTSNDFKTNYRTEGNESIEYVLLKDNKPYVAIELKGSNIDLDKYHNHKHETPMQQVARYANSEKSFKYCIVSNYNEFRIFSKDSRKEYVSYNITELTNTSKLKEFLLLFSKNSLIINQILNELINNTTIISKELENSFYNLYNETRLMLIKELQVTDESINKKGLSKLDSIHYAQLILNRYIFICFAEDKNLLPPDISIHTLKHALDSGLYETELWNQLTKLFRFINDGSSPMDINRFNGGLFKEKLIKLHIRDKVPTNFFNDCKKPYKFKEKEDKTNDLLNKYKHQYQSDNEIINPIFRNFIIISSFNFNTELDVNILGHIFENSIGDIEELKGETSSKRKKDGVYYTPAYITDYICRNTIIPYLSKTGDVNTVDELISEYNLGITELKRLDSKLKNIKILDPACGSGAFLNKACDILLEIHEKLHEHLYKNDKTLDPYFDNNTRRRTILIDNLYGVDLNEESVEITKLGMFLKVAKKGLELPTLDSNIRCGNSLISDSTIAGDKAFKWETEFKDILFNDGGFDIVIGNPPYVRQESIKELKPYLKNNYKCYTGVADLYVYFFEKGLNLLKNDGVLSFICSNKFTKARYGEKLRKLILDNQLNIYNDYTGEKIFSEASVDTCIIQIQKNGFNENNRVYVNNEYYMKQSMLNKDSFMFNKPEILTLRDKIIKQGTPIKDLDIQINRGVLTGFNDAFIIDEETKNRLIMEDSSCNEIIKPLLRGRDINKWQINYQELYLIHSYDGLDTKNDYPVIYEHLLQYEEKLKKRYDKGKEWYNLRPCSYDTLFEKPKIIYPNMASGLYPVYDNFNYFTNQKCYIMNSNTVNLKYLNGILVSNTVNFLFSLIGAKLGSKAYDLNKNIIEKLPIKFDENIESLIINEVDLILKNSKTLTTEINIPKMVTKNF